MADYSFTDADHAAVASATKILFSRYRQYVEYADVQQSLYLWILSNTLKVERWRTEYSEKHAERTLVKALRRNGEQYCRSEKAEKSGYSVEDEFFYSIPMIADLLQLSFDEDWMVPKGKDYTEPDVSGRAATENVVAMVADVGQGFNTLPEPDKELLRFVYDGSTLVNDAIAQKSLEWGITWSAANSRIRRVLGRLRASLGGENPWREMV